MKTESLRDNMTNLELVLNMLAEATTRREIEAQTGKKIVSRLNAEQALAAKEIEPNEEEKE